MDYRILPEATERWVGVVLVVLLAIGATFLVTFVLYRGGQLTDEHACWLAADCLVGGQPLYDSAATSVLPL